MKLYVWRNGLSGWYGGNPGLGFAIAHDLDEAIALAAGGKKEIAGELRSAACEVFPTTEPFGAHVTGGG